MEALSTIDHLAALAVGTLAGALGVTGLGAGQLATFGLLTLGVPVVGVFATLKLQFAVADLLGALRLKAGSASAIDRTQICAAAAGAAAGAALWCDAVIVGLITAVCLVGATLTVRRRAGIAALLGVYIGVAGPGALLLAGYLARRRGIDAASWLAGAKWLTGFANLTALAVFATAGLVFWVPGLVHLVGVGIGTVVACSFVPQGAEHDDVPPTALPRA